MLELDSAGAPALELMKDGREHARGRGDLVSRLSKQEAAGAVGRLQHAGRKASLPVGSSLLVAGDAPDRDRRAVLARGLAESALAVAHFGKKLARDTESIDQPLVPVPGADVAEHGAGGVARSHGMHLAAGELEQEKADTEARLACPGTLRKPGDIGEQPGELRRREIRIDDETAGFRDMDAQSLLPPRLGKSHHAPQLRVVRERPAVSLHWNSLADTRDEVAYCSAWLSLQCASIPGVTAGLVVLRQTNKASPAVSASWPKGYLDGFGELSKLAERAFLERRTIVSPHCACPTVEGLPPSPIGHLVAIPLGVGGRIIAAAAV